MPDFAVGDLVECVAYNGSRTSRSAPLGRIGRVVVLEWGSSVGVQFEVWTRGHSLGEHLPRTSKEGFWLDFADVKLVKRKPFNKARKKGIAKFWEEHRL